MRRSPAPLPTWLSSAECAAPSIRNDATLLDAIEAFRTKLDLRLLPVIDENGSVNGAIHERDVRLLLLNPFGHALMRNPAYGTSLNNHLRPCPVGERSLGLPALLDLYRTAGGTDGLVVTVNGKLHATVAHRRLMQLDGERQIADSRARIARAERIETLTAEFEAQGETLARDLSELARLVETNSAHTASRAGHAGARAAAVTCAAVQTAASIGEIAERGRGLATTLATIGASTARARASAADAVGLVAAGSRRAEELSSTAASIDSAISLIAEIAAKVNLLALNATIEAARAGEAGRGFTVVANEVKSLSQQTGSAANAITAHVESIRHAIDEVVAGHAQVETAIGAIAALSNDIEQAVGAQQAATKLIARNVGEVVVASDGIRNDVEAINGTAVTAADAASELSTFAHRLHQTAGTMSFEVKNFLAEIRAA